MAAVVVMAKAPRPGQVKTRMEPCLGRAGCAALQAALLRQAAGLAVEAAPDAAFVAYAPAEAEAELSELVPPGVALFPQHGASLGQRMAAAAGEVFRRHGGPLAVIGADAPTLDSARVGAAFAELAAGTDVCLGPARDGGYYLLAATRPAPALFDLPDQAWGGPEVLELTVRAVEAAGLSTALLPEEHDLDTPADAAALADDSRVPADVGALLTPCVR